MARTLEVYPKASLVGSNWTAIVKVDEAGTQSLFEHTMAANVVATTPLQLLKIVFELVVDDADTDQDVDDALFVDDIRPGPQVATVWTGWQAIAEGIIDGLSPDYTVEDFRAAWNQGDTQSMRNDIQRAFISGPVGIGRGWTINSFHQHEGDGTVTEG